MVLRYAPDSIVDDDILYSGTVKISDGSVQRWALVGSSATTSHRRELHVYGSSGVLAHEAIATVRRFGDRWVITGSGLVHNPYTSLEEAAEELPDVVMEYYRHVERR